MLIRYLSQPEGSIRLGEYLKTHLEDPLWTNFRAAVAFAKHSGVTHLRQALVVFSRKGAVKMSIGIDLEGTSAEGLRDLLGAVGDRGQIWVYHNANYPTFHPKVYLFKSGARADVLVGSGNLTEGGLFTNYEASLAVTLDLSLEADRLVLQEIEASLDSWSDQAKGTSILLTPDILDELVASGCVPTEASTREIEERAAGSGERLESPTRALLFASVPVRGAPPIPRPVADEDAASASEASRPEAGTSVPPPDGKFRGFVMILQRTDVGVGQTTHGTSRRSPEIFIPLVARDYAPDFWGWPGEFVDDPAKPGKKDRWRVRMRIGTNVVEVNMMTWPVKHDFRIRSESLRSAGDVGDVLRIERADGRRGFSYYVEAIPQGTTQYDRFLALCVNFVKSPNSKKRWGYY